MGSIPKHDVYPTIFPLVVQIMDAIFACLASKHRGLLMAWVGQIDLATYALAAAALALAWKIRLRLCS